MDFKPIALDLETTTSDPYNGRILSIGMVDYFTGKWFYEEVYYDEIIPVHPKAMEVNKLRLQDHLLDVYDFEKNRPLFKIQHQAETFLSNISYYPGKIVDNKNQLEQPIAMGLNVGIFDLLYLKNQMPELFKRFGYRSIDLNGLMYAHANKLSTPFKTIREGLNKRALEIIEPIKKGNKNYTEHHALYDCFWNCAIYSLLVGRNPGWLFED